MDITNLVYFTEIVNCQSITKAAEVLHMTQPTLSRRVFQLEEELGTELLDRNAKGVKLTPAGIYFYDYCKRTINKNRAMMHHMDMFRYYNSVRVGLSAIMNLRLLIDACNGYKKENPSVEFFFREGTPRECVELLNNGELDVVYSVPGEVELMDDIAYVPLLRAKLTVVVPRGHRLWDKPFLEPEDLEGETLSTYDQGGIRAISSPVIGSLTDSVGRDLFDLLEDVEYHNTAAEMLMAVTVNNHLAIGATSGTDYLQAFQDKLRNVPLNVDSSASNPVLAFRKDNTKIEEVVRQMARNAV